MMSRFQECSGVFIQGISVEPASFAEKDKKSDPQTKHAAYYEPESPFAFHEWHAREIHTVKSGDEGQRHKDSGDNGQYSQPLFRLFPGMGIRVWGARTVSSDPSWKYINVRRLFIFIEESIKANTNWAVFEPNDEVLWVRVKRTIDVFLTGMWRGGSLAGSVPAEAFFVNIGRDTMSQDDIDNGRLVCVIGVAPVKPAEFVIFRISQKTSDSGSAE